MKKFILILVLLFSLSCFTGCGYEETHEYPVESARYHEVIHEHGTFAKKQDIKKYIEYVYIDSNGEYNKKNMYVNWVQIASESKVVEEQGWSEPQLYLTLEEYNELLAE